MCPSSTTSSEGREGHTDSRHFVGEVERSSVLSRRAAMWFISIVFLGTLVVLGCIDTLFPVEKETLMGLQADLEVEARATANVLDGTRMRLFESDLKRSSRIRSKTLSPWASLLYGLCGAMRREAVVGRDGWLYFRERLQTQTPLTDQGIEEAAAALTALARRCEALGTHLVLAPVPEKAWVHPEGLPSGFIADAAGYRKFVAACEARGLTVANLLDAFKADGGLTYMRTDTHWSPRGSRVAAECIADAAGVSLPSAQRLGRVVQDGSIDDVGDLMCLSGIREPDVQGGGLQRQMLSLGGRLHSVPLEHFLFENGAPKAPDLKHPWIMVGTSFSASGHFQQALARSAGEMPLVRSVHAVNVSLVMQQFLSDLELAASHGITPRVAVLEFLATDVLNSRYSPRDILHAQFTPLPAGFRPVPAEWDVTLSKSSLLVPGEYSLSAKNLWVAPWRGTVLHPADGCLAVLIEGEVLEGAPRVIMHVGESSYYFTWEKERRALMVPIVGAKLTDGFTIALSAQTTARVRVDTVRLVTPLAPAAQLATIGSLQSDAQGFTQQVQCPAEPKPLGVALLELDISGSLPASLRVAVPAGSCEIMKPTRAARLFLPLPRETAIEVQISGAGLAPKRLVRKAGVLVQSPRG
ncbi:MAG: hypothetical protein EXS14_07360 [Planctomycetes bacterium]|nr:hypothetical protein [Planctomycetota bacterium]